MLDLTSERILLIGIAAGLALILVAVLLWKLRKSTSSTAATLRNIAIDRLQDILLPDGMGGQIHIEHLLLTRSGVIVVDVKGYVGTIFGSDRMDEWTAIGPKGRHVFPNPQATMLDRVAAVKELIRSMPVEGFVLFSDDADFSKGKPNHVMRVTELAERFEKPSPGETEQLARSYAPHWQRLKKAAASTAQRSAA